MYRRYYSPAIRLVIELLIKGQLNTAEIYLHPYGLLSQSFHKLGPKLQWQEAQMSLAQVELTWMPGTPREPLPSLSGRILSEGLLEDANAALHVIHTSTSTDNNKLINADKS